ncbi:MAG TPA: helix-turn-helix domain-containing protein [Solirubrobacteraceae bacterium]|nr:helix-turn-helix domain-containing protein [Solirubrobacteraceae bacterium]
MAETTHTTSAGTGADPGADTGADPGADPVATRPQRADARRNRGRILVAAAETFAERGADAQMDDVARRAGVGVGTVYRHFPTKESLMGELVRLKLDRMQKAAEAGLEVDDPWEAFAGVLRRGAEVMAADAALRDALGRVPEAWEHAAAERERLQAILAQVIRRGQEAGVIRPDFSVDEVPMLMCGVASSMSQHSDWDWRRHLELVLDGIRVR